MTAAAQDVETHPSTPALDALVAGIVTPTTRSIYLRDVREFLADLNEWFAVQPTAATAEVLLQWWLRKQDTPLSNGRTMRAATINRKVAAVRRFYREGSARQLLPGGVVDQIPTLRTSASSTARVLTRTEVWALLHTCVEDPTRAGIRDRLAIRLMLVTGARLAAVAQVQFSDFFWTPVPPKRASKGTTTAPTGEEPPPKGEAGPPLRLSMRIEERTLPLPNDMSPLLQLWTRRAAIDSGPVLRRIAHPEKANGAIGTEALTPRGLHDIVKRRSKAAGLGDDVGPNDLRLTHRVRGWLT